MARKKLWAGCCLVQLVAVLISIPCRADVVKIATSSPPGTRQISPVSKLVKYSTLAADLLSENAGTPQVVDVTEVKIFQAQNGINLVLSTNQSQQLKPVFRRDGNILVADIPNAQLHLTEGNLFDSRNPVKGIREVAVTLGRTHLNLYTKAKWYPREILLTSYLVPNRKNH